MPRSGKFHLADYACKMGGTSLAPEDIFRTPVADKKIFCDHQIKVVGGFCGEKRTRPWHVSLNSEYIRSIEIDCSYVGWLERNIR
jgi:hypothetical protein